MGILQVVDVTPQGAAPIFTNADPAGDEFPNDSKTKILVRNADAAPIDVTIRSQRQCDQGFTHDLVITVPAGEEREIGPFPGSRFNKADGRAVVNYTAVANVEIAASSI